jgi:hypothetical protein
MRFLTLLKRELQESLPWIILAVLLLLGICWFIIRMNAQDQGRWLYGVTTNGSVIDAYRIFRTDIMQESAGLMFYISIGLGIVLGFRHFWMPGFTGTWQFLIHRSVNRGALLSAKLIAASVVMLCLSIAWLLLAFYAHTSKKVIIPPESEIVGLGIFYAYLGFIVYIGTALCALSKTRWYTTKLFGLFFVLIMCILVVTQTSFLLAFLITAIVFFVLIVQIYETFLKREF